jgi:hypothetical protein
MRGKVNQSHVEPAVRHLATMISATSGPVSDTGGCCHPQFAPCGQGKKEEGKKFPIPRDSFPLSPPNALVQKKYRDASLKIKKATHAREWKRSLHVFCVSEKISNVFLYHFHIDITSGKMGKLTYFSYRRNRGLRSEAGRILRNASAIYRPFRNGH